MAPPIPGNGSVSMRRHEGYAVAAPGANTNILATALVPRGKASAFRLTICLTTASVLNLHTTDGTTAYVNGLNASNALNAGDVYTFTFSVDDAISYNFQIETDGVVRFLIVDEIIGGAL